MSDAPSVQPVAKAHGRALNFGMRAMKIEDLRALATKYLNIEPVDTNSMDKGALITQLSKASALNQGLASEISEAGMSVKPSFYLMWLAVNREDIPRDASVQGVLEQVIEQLNRELEQADPLPTYRNFRLEELPDNTTGDLVEVHFTWERIFHYWALDKETQSYIYKDEYELQFGFALLQWDLKKALIACHTLEERKYVSKILMDAYDVALTPMILTRKLLDQIGTFDKARRVVYFAAESGSDMPMSFTYSDKDLPTKSVARIAEANSNNQRKYSFFRLALGNLEEHGVGVTSDSGKVWIPRELRLHEVREYGISLLARMSRTVNTMAASNEYDDLLNTLGMTNLPELADIASVAVRDEVSYLIKQLANMLISRESERPYNVVRYAKHLATDGIPNLFIEPRLFVEDPETGDYALWVSNNTGLPQIRPKLDGLKVVLTEFKSGQTIDTRSLEHPITGNRIVLEDPLGSLQFIPTSALLEKVTSVLKMVSSQVTTLPSFVDLPFRIEHNKLIMDFARATGRAGIGTLPTLLRVTDVEELRRIMNVPRRDSDIQAERPTLIKLGEQCDFMNDYNCKVCVKEQKYISLRSLVGRYISDPRILAHKGIENSDIEGTLTIDGQDWHMLGFAKLAESREKGLTALNSGGASLLAQVLSQVDKDLMNIAVVITPAILNDKLEERLKVICRVFGKKLLVLDEIALGRMLLDLKEQLAFDAPTRFEKMLANSKAPKSTSSRRSKKSKEVPSVLREHMEG